MVMGISVTVALFFTSTWLAKILGNASAGPLIAALSASFAIGAVASVSEGLAARRLQFRILAVRKVAAYLLGYGAVGIVSALLGAGAWALVYAQLAQASLEALLLIAAVRFDWRPTIKWSAYREILGYGSGYSVAQVVNSIANQLDRAVVAKYTTTAAVGLYTRAVQITRYPHRMIGQVIEDVLFPSFAGVQADREHLSRAFYRSIGSIFVVMTPVSVFFSVAARPITNLLLGPQWGEAVVLIAAFGASIPFRSAQRISSALLRAVGQFVAHRRPPNILCHCYRNRSHYRYPIRPAWCGHRSDHRLRHVLPRLRARLRTHAIAKPPQVAAEPFCRASTRCLDSVRRTRRDSNDQCHPIVDFARASASGFYITGARRNLGVAAIIPGLGR